ncbi:hypothetical protein pEaSNUABM56_00001 [Erwinia phage pEa_SNUABM_56]|uniref:Uncharacterized protein n=1 Tax=Erwinia phage pEp_SNUABM_01 TaxID=2601643 RepID=A0A5J6DBD2_9CAUD|nr:hypothetical protein HWC63_gp127 [Erwinia phage pEp_SNUABM_01]QEQ95051.1 hypothetical protein pEpSNUABM01_225 [Erwinia phage pEp_SNUABM_01]UYL84979.1 hypothetical protein pEaSNUABM55_00206 [Erwinia phage pEa_SNUABM_55]UYL85046.1 hypothetical protein pEaSNUABM56_00001 [Erwinia phage pEa_SNUABM_56]
MANAKNFFFLSGNVADRVEVEFRSFDDKMLLTFTDQADKFKTCRLEVVIRTEVKQTVNAVYRDSFISYALDCNGKQIQEGESSALTQDQVIGALISIVNDVFPIDGENLKA